MRNNLEKRSIRSIPAYLLILFLFCGIQLTACTSIVIHLPASIGTATTAGTPSTAQESQIAQSVFNAINKDRATAGLAALHSDAALIRSARQHNLAMMQADQLEHQLSGEAQLGDREKQQGVSWMVAEENIGFTEDVSETGALALHQAMMAERPPDDGHRQNILNGQVNQLGVDILFDNVHGRLWLTEDFAQVV